MSDLTLERRRTGWDVILGILLAVAGLVILGHTVIATAVSVFFLGWMAFLGGVAALVGSLFRIRDGGFWTAAIGGGLLTVIGLFFLRNPGVAALTLTLVMGSLFFASGLTRVVLAFQDAEHRWSLLLGGLVSLVLGVLVLFNLVTATFTLLGVLLGVEVLMEGFMLMLDGRLRVRAGTAAPLAAGR